MVLCTSLRVNGITRPQTDVFVIQDPLTGAVKGSTLSLLTRQTKHACPTLISLLEHLCVFVAPLTRLTLLFKHCNTLTFF